MFDFILGFQTVARYFGDTPTLSRNVGTSSGGAVAVRQRKCMSIGSGRSKSRMVKKFLNALHLSNE